MLHVVGIYRPTLMPTHRRRLTDGSRCRPIREDGPTDFARLMTGNTNGNYRSFPTGTRRPNRPTLPPIAWKPISHRRSPIGWDITDSLSGVAADVRLPQGTRSADDVLESSPDVPTAEYRHIVDQPTQTPYNRYGLLSCQGHAVWPP